MSPRTDFQLLAEHAYMRDRFLTSNGDNGTSSDALVRHVITGEPLSSHPHDYSDLGRCVRATLRAPLHLRVEMAPLVLAWADDVAGRDADWDQPSQSTKIGLEALAANSLTAPDVVAAALADIEAAA